MNMRTAIACLVGVLLPQTARAQHACQFYAQNPASITVDKSSGAIEREVEIDFTNTGASTWQNTGGVSNLSYIELRGADSGGNVVNSPLYHSSWINRQRVGSFLAVQNGVAPRQVARFVFKIIVDPQALGIGTHDCYFIPYHAQGGYIYDWGHTKIRVIVTDNSQPPPGQVPTASIVSIVPGTAVLRGTQVTASGAANNAPIEYRWRLGGQIVGNQSSFQSTFSQAGSFTLSFAARNAYGWSQEVNTTITVKDPAPAQVPPPDPSPVPVPAPTGLTAAISEVNVERSLPYTQQGAGARVTTTNWLSERFELRRYHVLSLRATVTGGSAQAYEWSLSANGVSKVIGSSKDLTTKPDDLFVGKQKLRFRAQGLDGLWSSYNEVELDVAYWPQIYLPVDGQWVRSGNNYNEGDHIGDLSFGAQDWNAPVPGNTDFGLEMIATIPGKITTGVFSGGGRYVMIEWTDTLNQAEFRAYYMHLSSVLVSDGQTVIAGQPIGLCGDTGSLSQGTHLHYVLRRKENGVWKGVIPEPCWIDTRTVRQTIAYNEAVWADHRVLPVSVLILPEDIVTAPYSDEEGWGHHKYWAKTTSQRQPTSSALWDATIPVSGTWRLWMHNPTARTHDEAGQSTHNTTACAPFEIARPRQLGLDMISVNQDVGYKGSLILIMEFRAQAGDNIKIRQHNATGEDNKEISFDQLVLTMESRDDTGGADTVNGVPTPVPVPDSATSNMPASPPSVSAPPSQPTIIHTGGGGGCAINPCRTNSAISCLILFLFTLLILSARMRAAA